MWQKVINSDDDQESKEKKVQSYISSLMNYVLYDKNSLLSTERTILESDMASAGIESYRSGLSYVLYDDYLVNLHRGEEAITSATVTELRALISEYRRSRQINANIDTIIQNQSTTLFNKLDEVIGII